MMAINVESLCKLISSRNDTCYEKAAEDRSLDFSSAKERDKVVCTQIKPTRRGSELLPVRPKEDGCQESSETTVQTVQPKKGGPELKLTICIQKMLAKHQNGERQTEKMTSIIEMETTNFTEEAISYILPDYPKSEISTLKYITKKSGRGEHVINQHVLKFHTKVKKIFDIELNSKVVECSCEKVKEFLQQHINYGFFPDSETRKAVTEMVAYFDENEVYINNNAFVYGIYIKELTNTLVKILMMKCCSNKVEEKLSNKLNLIVTGINKFQVFVDFFAREKWTVSYNSDKKVNTAKVNFEKVNKKVEDMFTDLLSVILP